MSAQNELDKQSCKIITFNGQGCSGKTTQSRLLVKSNEEKYRRIYSYKLREDFEEKVYESLCRRDTCIKYPDSDTPDQTLHMVEVLGIPTLAWLMAQFYKEVKPLQENYIVVLDHYIGDFYADMLKGFDPAKFQNFVKDHLGIPHFKQGTHFYLDIDYNTYQDRWGKREGTKPPVLSCTFEERRKRYKELCELKYLKCIDATANADGVFEQIQEVLTQ